MTQALSDNFDAVDWGNTQQLLERGPTRVTAIEAPPPERPVTRKTIEVICCPRCTSTRVGPHDWHAGDRTKHWQCRDCHQLWKESADVGGQKAHIP